MVMVKIALSLFGFNQDLDNRLQFLENGKVYEFYLKENVVWQDSKPLTADDVPGGKSAESTI